MVPRYGFCSSSGFTFTVSARRVSSVSSMLIIREPFGVSLSMRVDDTSLLVDLAVIANDRDRENVHSHRLQLARFLIRVSIERDHLGSVALLGIDFVADRGTPDRTAANHLADDPTLDGPSSADYSRGIQRSDDGDERRYETSDDLADRTCRLEGVPRFLLRGGQPNLHRLARHCLLIATTADPITL